MPRKRVYKAGSMPRFGYKMARLYVEGKTGLLQEYGEAMVTSMVSDWNTRFGEIHVTYEDFIKKNPDIKPALRGLARSALLYVMRCLKRGVSLDTAVKHLEEVGIPAEVIERVRDYVTKIGA